MKVSTTQLNHLLPCVRHVVYLGFGIPRSKIRRTTSDPVKAFLLAFFVSFEPLFVLPIRSARCFALPFVQKKVNKFSFSPKARRAVPCVGSRPVPRLFL